MITITVSASAMSYEQARQQALFLTDKMAYELNLTDAQYEAAYEVNLDYLMGVNTYDDLYGAYWRQRNADLSYILLDWQYRTYLNASYFYRPLYWDAGYWHFGIYARYPRRDYFFFGRPEFYTVYRGAHSWRENGGRSWYHGRDFGGPRPGDGPRGRGMRDGFNRGDYGRGWSFGSMNRQSSTRTTVTRPSQGNNRPFGNRGFFGSGNGSNNRSFGNGSRPSDSNRSSIFGGGNSTRSFGNGGNAEQNRRFTPRSTPNNSSFGGGNRSGGSSFGNGNRSFGGANNSGPSTRSNGGNSFSGGGHFGGGHR